MYIFGAKASNKYESEVGHTIQYVTLQHLLNLLADDKSIPQVKGLVNTKLDAMVREFQSRGEKVFSKQLVREIVEFREHPERFKMIKTPRIPDGSPIGSFECYYD
jgi:hypothetical protein